MSARRRGFTLIELMVVVAIVVMAMGIMTPSLIEFFRNQKLKNVRAHFVSAFNIARLLAITEGTPMQVVFFREGVRVYHERNRGFRKEEEFNPEGAPGSKTGITFDLRFAKLENSDLVAYRDWEKKQPELNAVNSSNAGQCSVDDLIALEFHRDGSISWLNGENVPTAAFNQDPPEDADLIVKQEGNPQALYIDVSQTGKIRVKFAAAPGEHTTPRR